jgi:hypothetical protein
MCFGRPVQRSARTHEHPQAWSRHGGSSRGRRAITAPWPINDPRLTRSRLDCRLLPEPRSTIMPKGDKSSYTDKQKRQAEHIEKSEKDEGKSEKTAERIAWATVNKQDGGGKKKKK